MIHPNGSIPIHAHETEETYIILSGHGIMTVGEEEQEVDSHDIVYIPPFVDHGLRNTGVEEMSMMFVYAPSMVAEHWAQETSGQLR
jgi:mannose-6-phosphate isomerase-like protein (cupin superfamily)